MIPKFALPGLRTGLISLKIGLISAAFYFQLASDEAWSNYLSWILLGIAAAIHFTPIGDRNG